MNSESISYVFLKQPVCSILTMAVFMAIVLTQELEILLLCIFGRELAYCYM